MRIEALSDRLQRNMVTPLSRSSRFTHSLRSFHTGRTFRVISILGSLVRGSRRTAFASVRAERSSRLGCRRFCFGSSGIGSDFDDDDLCCAPARPTGHSDDERICSSRNPRDLAGEGCKENNVDENEEEANHAGAEMNDYESSPEVDWDSNGALDVEGTEENDLEDCWDSTVDRQEPFGDSRH